ncbi:aldose 1-epimerase [Teladorsagia circumcincta]|uniref:Galactose mutarotase n=1 Tax=Teladorsagia circumcincta TaxID=45464 RepID=A0A2G9TZC6_TELCI|nr:aldose 1-epimerase [Teladorsagia circumcincta]
MTKLLYDAGWTNLEVRRTWAGSALLKITSDKEWEIARQTPTSVTFRIWTDEENDGFPGDAKIDVTYTVNDMNQLVIEHGATCTSPGVLNLTNHSYWNLDGSETVRDHLLQIDADAYLPTDQNDFPTGEIVDVQGTRFDFTEEKPLKSLLDDKGNIDIDNDLVLSPDRSRLHALSYVLVSIIFMILSK